MKLITDWFRQQFSNPQVVFLSLFLLALFVVVVVSVRQELFDTALREPC